MKLICLLFILFFLTTANAQFMSLDDIALVQSGQTGFDSHWSMATCEAKESSDCVDVRGYDVRKITVGMVDDLDSPIYAKQEIEACSDEVDCYDKSALKSCGHLPAGTLKIVNAEFTEVYCAVISGYNQKPNGVSVDPTLEAQIDAAYAAKSAKQTALNRLQSRKKCGEEVIEGVRLLIDSKGWDKSKYDSLKPTFDGIISYLELGQLEFAKTDAEAYAVTADVTQDDKDSAIAAIDACIAAYP